MSILLLLISILFFLAFATFIYFNFNLIIKSYNKFGESYFAGLKGGSAFLKQAKYFSLTEKNLGGVSVVCALIFGLLGLSLKIGIFGLLFGMAGGWLLPNVLLSYFRRKHLKKLNDQLYSALILLGNSMKAGETLPQAIESTKAILGDPISQEFEIIARQIKMGIPVAEALGNFAARTDLEDVDLAVRAMNISLKTGANLPRALSKIAETIRARNALNNKIDTLTIQGKAQGVVVGLLPFFIGAFLFWNNPDYIMILFTTFGGHCVVATIIILEILAFLTIRKISTIEI